MTQLNEAIETYLYVISGLSEHTQLSYRDKLRVFERFCTEREIDLENITPKVFKHFICKSFHSVGGILVILWALFALVLFFRVALEAHTKLKQGVSSRRGCLRFPTKSPSTNAYAQNSRFS